MHSLIRLKSQNTNDRSMMKCLFGLKEFEARVMYALIEEPPMTVDETVKIVGLDRSTVQRALLRLTMEGLISREQKNLKEGGYYYLYRVPPEEDLKKLMKQKVKVMKETIFEWLDDPINTSLPPSSSNNKQS